MNHSDYCNCNEFEKVIDYDAIRYYRPENDRLNAVKAGLVYQVMGSSFESFRHCP